MLFRSKAIINQEGAPVLCFATGTISNDIDSSSNPELYAQYETLAPLEGPDGTRLTTFFRYLSISDGNFCITDTCKSPEAALRWADFFYSETGDLMSQYGAEEGVDWELNPEGEFGLDGEPADYKILNPYSAETQNHEIRVPYPVRQRMKGQDRSLQQTLRHAPARYSLLQSTG